MTDIFGAVSAAVEITRMLIKYGNEVKGAKADTQRLSEKIEAVDTVMKQIQMIFDDLGEDKKNYLEYRDWVADLKAKTKSYERIISELKAYCSKRQSRWQQLKHPLKRELISGKLADVKWYYDVLQDSLQVLQAHRTAKGVGVLKLDQKNEKDVAEWEKGVRDLYADTSPVERKMYGELDKCRGSEPAWIIKRPEFLEWKDGSLDKDSILWAKGRPGAGKTCIASFIASKLLDITEKLVLNSQSSGGTTSPDQTQSRVPGNPQPVKPLCGIAIFFCNYRNPAGQDVETVFRCLCRQLLDQLYKVDSSNALDIVKSYHQKKQKVSSKEAAMLLLDKLSRQFQRTYLVIDALDENEHLESLLQELRHIFDIPSVKSVLTAREGEALDQASINLNAKLIIIRPNESQIRNYVDYRLGRIADGHEFGSGIGLKDMVKDARGRNTVADAITVAADGNYLCAELHINILRKATGKTDLQQQLKNLPNTLKDLFRDTMERIRREDERNGWKRGSIALMWTLYSFRPLTVKELSHAIAIHSSRVGRKGPITNSPTLQEVLESTCYFLTIDETTLRIQVHKAVKDYCKEYSADVEEVHFGGNPHKEIAIACLKYLSLDTISGAADSFDEFNKRTLANPLFLYAAENWGFHIELGDETQFLQPDSNNIIELLEDDSTVQMLGQALHIKFANDDSVRNWPGDEYVGNKSELVDLNPGDKPLMPAIHILIYFDLRRSALKLLSESTEALSSRSRLSYTPIWLACRLGNKDIANALLRKGADPTSECWDGRYCIHAAVFYAHVEVVKLLLNHQKHAIHMLVQQKNWWGRTAIADAAASGQTAIFKLLLDAMINIPERDQILLSQDNGLSGLLHLAAGNNRADIIAVLREKSECRSVMRSMMRQTGVGWKDYPIHCAVSHAKLEALEILLDIDPSQLELKQSQGRNILSLVVEHDFRIYGKLTQLILKFGADPTVPDSWKGMTALHGAAYWGQALQVKHLLKDDRCRALLETTDDGGFTPLQIALKEQRYQWVQVVALLKAAGAKGPDVDVRAQTVSYTKDDDPNAYVISAAIPPTARLPIQSIQFKFLSRDQGLFDANSSDDGTYRGSFTWFEATCWRDCDLLQQLLLTHNLRVTETATAYEITWDVERGHIGNGSRANDADKDVEVTKFLLSLKHGDRVALIPRAAYPGWINFIDEAEIKLEFVEESF